jgi:TRAP transporter TAXI family solute receptor
MHPADPRSGIRIGPNRRNRVRGSRRMRLLLSLLVATAIHVGCSRPQRPPRAAPRTLRLTTGTPGAGFNPLGFALATAYRAALPNLQVSISESPGSVRNVEALQRGDADMGFAFADVAYVAFVGRLDGHTSYDKLRGIAVLQLNPLHIVVGAHSTIRTVADLRGRRVGLGPPGSGTALTASLVLHSFGIDPASLQADLLPFNEASARLTAGRLDAIFVNASYPSESVVMATRAGARLLAIEGPAVDRLRHDYPFLRLTSIPAGTYPLHTKAVHTVGVDNLLLSRSDLDEDLVYELTKQFFALLPTLAAAQTSLRAIDFTQMPATSVPLHEGAARYYRERELLR